MKYLAIVGRSHWPRLFVLGALFAVLLTVACASKPPPATPAPAPSPVPAPAAQPEPSKGPSPSPLATPALAPAATPTVLTMAGKYPEGQPLVPGGPPFYPAKLAQTQPVAVRYLDQYHQTKMPLWTKAVYGGEERWAWPVTSILYLDFLKVDNMARIGFSGRLLHFDSGLCSLVGREGHFDTCNGQYAENDVMVILPGMLEKWEQTDPLTYVLRLRKGVLWPAVPPMNRTDREVTAQDVTWFLDITKREGALGYTMELAKSFEAVDRYTVRVNMQGPNAEFIRHLAHPSMGIFPKECYDEKGCLGTKLISPAPFLMTVNEDRKRLVFDRNPEYFLKGLPYYDRYTILNTLDPAAQKALLVTGQIDATGGGNPSEVANLQKQIPGLRVQQNVRATLNALVMPQLKGPFADVRVRRAMTMTLDLLTAWDVAYEGAALFPWLISRDYYGAGFFMTLEQAGQWYQFNPQRAKQLLAEAGYPNGFSATLTTSTTSGGGYDQLLFSQSQWKKYLNIDLQIRVVEAVTVATQITESSWTDLVAGDPRRTGWPSADLSMVVFTKGQPKNFQKIDDLFINDLYLKQRGELDPAKRSAMLWQFEQYELDQIYLFRMSTTVGGWVFQPWDSNQVNHGVWYSMGWLAMIDTTKQPKR